MSPFWKQSMWGGGGRTISIKLDLDFVNNFSFFDRYLSLSRFSPVLNTFPFQDSLGLL